VNRVGYVFSLWLVAAVGVGPSVAQGQESGQYPRIFVADSLHLEGELDSALSLFRAIVDERPDDLVAIWRTAREAVAVGVTREGFDSQKVFFDMGI
jgi:hypothetical protein